MYLNSGHVATVVHPCGIIATTVLQALILLWHSLCSRQTSSAVTHLTWCVIIHNPPFFIINSTSWFYMQLSCWTLHALLGAKPFVVQSVFILKWTDLLQEWLLNFWAVPSWLVETSRAENLAALKTTELNLCFAPGVVWLAKNHRHGNTGLLGTEKPFSWGSKTHTHTLSPFSKEKYLE